MGCACRLTALYCTRACLCQDVLSDAWRYQQVTEEAWTAYKADIRAVLIFDADSFLQLCPACFSTLMINQDFGATGGTVSYTLSIFRTRPKQV